MLWVLIVIFIVLLIIGFVFKITKTIFKIMGYVMLAISLGGILLTILAYIEASELKEDFAQGPLVFFVEGETILGGSLLKDGGRIVSEQSIQSYDLKNLALDDEVQRYVIVDVSILEDMPQSGGYQERAEYYHNAFADYVDENGTPAILRQYILGNIEFYPEPISFKFIRKQPLIPLNTILDSPIFSKVVDGGTAT